MTLHINASLALALFKDGKEVSDPKEKKQVLQNLQNGEFVIGLASRSVYDLEDLLTPIYTFEFDVIDGEYEFEDEDEEYEFEDEDEE
jgi:hypothetical protein